MRNRFILLVVILVFNLINASCNKNDSNIDSFKDARDGTVYKTVKIGNQEWMAENLAYKSNGNQLPYNNEFTNIAIYGYLYDWQTSNGVCPDGWHLPSDKEWKELTDFLGGDSIAGGKMMETGVMHWNSPNDNATNESGFNALPGGFYNRTKFLGLGGTSIFWTSTIRDISFSLTCSINQSGNANHWSSDKRSYHSVRCVKN